MLVGNGSADSRDRKLGRVMTNVEEILWRLKGKQLKGEISELKDKR